MLEERRTLSDSLDLDATTSIQVPGGKTQSPAIRDPSLLRRPSAVSRRSAAAFGYLRTPAHWVHVSTMGPIQLLRRPCGAVDIGRLRGACRDQVAEDAAHRGRASFAGLAGGPQWIRSGYAVGTQQYFRQLPMTKRANCLTCGDVSQPSELGVTNAQIVSFASSRSGVRIPLAPQSFSSSGHM